MLTDLTILVVDEEPATPESIQTTLRPGRDKLDVRMSGRAALDALRDQHYDLVLCELRPAAVNDFEFVRIARMNYPALAIIVFAEEDLEEGQPLTGALKAGADGYISKPLSPQKLTLLFERGYWEALSREDWWQAHNPDPMDDGHAE